MSWTVSIGTRVSIDYDDINAEDRESAIEEAKCRALEDIEVNNADICYDDLIVYCAFENDESDIVDN